MLFRLCWDTQQTFWQSWRLHSLTSSDTDPNQMHNYWKKQSEKIRREKISLSAMTDTKSMFGHFLFLGRGSLFYLFVFLRQTYLSLHFFVHFLFTCQVTARLQCRVSQVCYYDVPTAWIKHKSLNSLLAGNYFLAVWSPATLVSFSCMEEGSRTAGYVLSQTTLCAFEHR